MKLLLVFVVLTSLLFAQKTKVFILTASKNGNYWSFINQKKDKCNHIELIPIATRGSIDNIKKLVQKNSPYHYALVQNDVFEFFNTITNNQYNYITMKNHPHTKHTLLKKLNIVKNYQELVYIIKLKKNKKFSTFAIDDLQNKKLQPINIGRLGSGSSITGYKLINLFNSYKNIQLQITQNPKEEALNHLLSEKISMMIYVARKDAHWIKSIFQKYGKYLELISIAIPKNIDLKYNFEKTLLHLDNFSYQISTIVVKTAIISTKNNPLIDKEVEQCLNLSL